MYRRALCLRCPDRLDAERDAHASSAGTGTSGGHSLGWAQRAQILRMRPHKRIIALEPLTTAELGDTYGPLVRFAAATGLRPAEWIALERRDVDRRAGVVVVERSFSGGRAKPYARTERSRRRVVKLACEGSLGAGLKSVPFDHARQIPATCCVFCSPGG
jgi:hypothetical protein